jgi:D-sedoheptulose 7-phosphate isomerase
MQESITEFRDNYAERVCNGISEFLESDGLTIIRRIQDSVSRSRNNIYAFGNGGSHAISKCFQYAVESYAAAYKLPVRIETGVDVHRAPGTTRGEHGISFVEILKREGADRRDLVILISGSGESDNLCEVAQHTKICGIPTLAITGFDQGKLRDFVDSCDYFTVPVKDQQISEDIIQALAYFLDQAVSDLKPEVWSQKIATKVPSLRAAISAIPETFVTSIADAVVDAFISHKLVWVFGFDHPALNICAEHTAHNLYWDGVYEVRTPPHRFIFSSPTACDLSGISNDRSSGVLQDLTGIADGRERGMALLYSMDTRESGPLLTRLNELSISSFLFVGKGSDPSLPSVMVHETGLTEPQLAAGVAQILGHILGRVIRLRLLEANGSSVDQDLSNPAQFLINNDLAQRRLLRG